MSASDTTAAILRGLAKGNRALGIALPGIGPAVAAMAAEALELAADFAEAGADVSAELQRIRRSHDLLEGLRDDWNNRIADKFGPAVEATSEPGLPEDI